MLVEGRALSLDDPRAATARVSGFLFDMNRFFQALLSRFLRENLAGYEVRDEFGISHMMRYAPEANPRNRRGPRPRPDFAIMRGGRLLSLLDAKYRDLWERSLPRDILYQLAIYGLSQGVGATASILHPVEAEGAREQRIEITDPVSGQGRAYVALHPVHLETLADLIGAGSPIAGTAEGVRAGDGVWFDRLGPARGGPHSSSNPYGSVRTQGSLASARLIRGMVRGRCWLVQTVHPRPRRSGRGAPRSAPGGSAARPAGGASTSGPARPSTICSAQRTSCCSPCAGVSAPSWASATSLSCSSSAASRSRTRRSAPGRSASPRCSRTSCERSGAVRPAAPGTWTRPT